ncbi:MAG TPA: transposase [Candidatus Sulfotelmatobacter sp.]|nr:transposase [Candidatus Sulfotelmatobacter sp.]
MKRFVCRQLRLAAYLVSPGDGRPRPRIPAAALLWAQLIGQVLREAAFHAIEALVRSPARRALGVSHRFGDDALGYFTAQCDPTPTRQALVQAVRRAKRNKAFEAARFIGLALDGTAVGRCATARCPLCRPQRAAAPAGPGYDHRLVLLTVVGTGLTLPVDVEPYGPGDSEYAAGQRLLGRAVAALGARFATYVVVDGEFATAPFLHTAGDRGLRVVARLKANLPELTAAVQARFGGRAPTATFQIGGNRVELWDADDFDPWGRLRWPTVRVLRYRQAQPDGTVVTTDWLTDFPVRQVSARSLYLLAKSRWEVENQGFNDGKVRYGLAHIRHHHAASLLLCWLLVALGLTIERLYRLRYLHRGPHTPPTAMGLVRLLRLSLGAPLELDTS